MKLTHKRTYFNLAMQQDVNWLINVAREPNRYQIQRPVYLSLIKLAIRKKGGAI